MTKVLIVDDDPVQLRITSEIASRAGFEVATASGGSEALALLQNGPAIAAMVLDLVMPDLDGLAVLEALARNGRNLPVIVQTASSSLDTVVSAMRLGAVDFFVKPVATERLTVSLRNALQMDHLQACLKTERARLSGTLGFDDIVTTGSALARTLELARKASRSTIPVLIEGESGTGKELIARAIQGSSDRGGKPFIVVNCGAIPANLVESTLFGHVKGAFTGAIAANPGKFREAHGGTLFLDEIGELPAEAQVKLLRVLQNGEIEPVGAAKSEKVNVRVISATNRRLLNLARTGEFREDLYYRLNVFPIYVPPLRDRREDIAVLAGHFLARFAAEAGRRITGLEPEALDLLLAHDWPGNIRQLENAVYRAVVLSEQDTLRPDDFPQISALVHGSEGLREAVSVSQAHEAPVHIDDLPALGSAPAAAIAKSGSAARDRFIDDNGEILPLSAIEREVIACAIERYDGHMSRIARALGIGRSTLYRKLREYDLDGATGELAA